jgi:hypothetical protein
MRVAPLDESAWRDADAPVAICVLPFTPEQFSARHGVQFTDCPVEGLGLSRSAFARIGGVPCLLQAYPETSGEARFLTVWIRSDQGDSAHALEEVLSGLGLDTTALRWRAEDLGPPRWTLHRLDDNGSEVEMQRFLSRESAERARERYAGKGHKQTYSVRPAPP